jgi:hypothetical protein
VYRLDFQITLTQRIGKALPIQKTLADRVMKAYIKAIYREWQRATDIGMQLDG